MKTIGEGLALLIIGIPGFLLVLCLFIFLWQEYGFAGLFFSGMVLWILIRWAWNKAGESEM